MEWLFLGALGALAWRGMMRKTRVLHMERADGVDPRLIGLLKLWEREGSFVVQVAPDGGLRIGPEAQTKQLQFFTSGTSNAATLEQTPHGRGGAIDVWPLTYNGGPEVTALADSQFRAFGEWAESKGFVWGGRWTKPYDRPHIEVMNWRALPMPTERGYA